MSTKRDVTPSVPSVMARLMGLDEIPIQRPVQKKPRVLSENYLHRVSSIGARKKCSDQESFKLGNEQQVEYKNVLQVLETLRTKNHSDIRRLAMSKPSQDIRRSDLKSPKKVRNVDSVNEFWRLILNPRNVVIKPDPLKKNEILFSPSRNLCVEKKERKRSPNGVESVRPRARFRKERTKMVGQSTSTMSTVEPRSELGSNNYFVKEPSVLSDKKKQISTLGTSYMIREAKKQVTERGKTTKRFKHSEIAARSESRSKSPFAFFNSVESPNSKLRQKSVGSVGYVESVDLMPNGAMDRFNVESQGLKTKSPLDYEKHQFESFNYRILEKEHSSLHCRDALHVQEISNENFDGEESISSQCSLTDPESLISFEEAYQPSPNSVLERLDKKQTSSDCFKSVNASLHGLHLQLELLKSKESEPYSEGSSMIVSSDEDNDLESEKTYGLLRPFRVKESRDFSYMVDVLTDSGLQNGNFNDKYPICNSHFETLEKKYGEQISWKRSERRLLFDRINYCLEDFFQALKGTLTLTKSLAKRVRCSLGDDMVEEVWALLVSQEEEVSKEEKMLGKDDRWMELGEEIRVVGREIEDYLIDELVADVSMDSF